MSCFVLALHMLQALSLSLPLSLPLHLSFTWSLFCYHPSSSSLLSSSSLSPVLPFSVIDHSSIIEFSLHTETGERNGTERKHTNSGQIQLLI
uniref:Putative secreted peptide n=1 Tax=Anopheles braziliensis TaxID=58242 RepID=A0A2M3ZTU4_9DIPT